MCGIQFGIVNLPVFCEKLSWTFIYKIFVVFSLHGIAVCYPQQLIPREDPATENFFPPFISTIARTRVELKTFKGKNAK